MFLLALAACGSSSGGPHKPSVKTGSDEDGGAASACVDKDEDGFGKNCDLGNDCDDNDPATTDECRRCLGIGQGCPCKPGTMWVSCDPPVKHEAGRTLVCTEGTRYCRDGYWGKCEATGQYVFTN